MKKSILYLLVFILIVSGCKKKNEEVPQYSLSEFLIGNWYSEDFSLHGYPYWGEGFIGTLKTTFRPNNLYTITYVFRFPLILKDDLYGNPLVTLDSLYSPDTPYNVIDNKNQIIVNNTSGDTISTLTGTMTFNVNFNSGYLNTMTWVPVDTDPKVTPSQTIIWTRH